MSDVKIETMVAEAKSTNSKLKSNIPIGEDVSQTKVLVVALRVQIKKVRYVNVGKTEFVFLANIVLLAGFIVIDFNTLYFKASHSVR